MRLGDAVMFHASMHGGPKYNHGIYLYMFIYIYIPFRFQTYPRNVAKHLERLLFGEHLEMLPPRHVHT